MTLFRTIVADPPWPMAWRGGGMLRKNGEGRVYRNAVALHRALPYPTMSIDDIAALRVSDVAQKNAVLFLWAPDVFIIDGSAARVARAWGFKPQRLFVWRKRGFGMGTFPRPQHEAAIYARRGSLSARRRDLGSVQEFKLVYERRGKSAARKHSAKPPDFLAMVETVFDGPYLELFARVPRIGWTSYGDEVVGGRAIADRLEGDRLTRQEGLQP